MSRTWLQAILPNPIDGKQVLVGVWGRFRAEGPGGESLARDGTLRGEADRMTCRFGQDMLLLEEFGVHGESTDPTGLQQEFASCDVQELRQAFELRVARLAMEGDNGRCRLRCKRTCECDVLFSIGRCAA